MKNQPNDKRHPASQVQAIRERNRSNYAQSVLFERRNRLDSILQGLDQIPQELLKWLPVAIVATAEGFFRLQIKELLDTNDSYARSATNLHLNAKLDLEMVRAIQGKAWTFGELISHALPMNNLDQIASHMTHILGKDFLPELEKHVDRWSSHVEGKPAVPMLLNANQVYASVARTFELRHIFAHELATGYEPNRDEIRVCYIHSMQFLECAQSFLADIAQPNAPLTQSEMNAAAFADFGEAEKERTEVVEQVCARLDREDGTRSVTLRQLEEAWRVYRDKLADWESSEFEGGSIQPLIRATSATDTTKEFTEKLKAELSRIEP